MKDSYYKIQSKAKLQRPDSTLLGVYAKEQYSKNLQLTMDVHAVEPSIPPQNYN